MALAFAIQAFIVQTHVHPAGFSDSGAVIHAEKSAPSHPSIPTGDDPANCPLCKEILYSGQFVGPAWTVFFLPTLAVSVIETALLPVSGIDTASHAWSSRAPPRN